MKPRYYIGIDSGVNTGFAVWDAKLKCFDSIESTQIHRAIDWVKNLYSYNIIEPIHVRVEDARQRNWFGKSGKEVLQGVGSVKRDAKIWEDFLTDNGISFEMVAPKNNTTKLKAESFKNITKWEGKTNEHGRDAAMLVFNF